VNPLITLTLKVFARQHFIALNVSLEGNLGGIIIIWKSSRFNGLTLFQNRFALNIELTSKFSRAKWILSGMTRLSQLVQ
jgi:hypothetical protein